MTEYVREFVEETEQAITELNNLLLDLERSPDDQDVLQEIFRTAHTLKGNAGAMGLDRVSDLAHAMEDLLDAIRADEVAVTADLMDTIFEAVDCLERMTDEVATEGTIQTDPSSTIASLRAPLSDGSIDVNPPSGDELAATLSGFSAPSNPDHDAFLVRLALADSGELNNGLVVVEALVDAFDLIGTDPSRTAIENEEYGNRIDAVFASAVGEDSIAAALEPVGAVEAFSILTVTDQLAESDDESSHPPDVGEDIGSHLTSDEANEMSVDELLDEFNELDDIDALADEIEDASEFDDIGDAGSFADIVSDPEPISEAPDDSTPSVTDDSDDSEEVEDAGAVFKELKEEVEMVGFDELQDELADLEFDEFDEEEVEMDELLGDDVDVDDPTFLDTGRAGSESENVPLAEETTPESDTVGLEEAPSSPSDDSISPTWDAEPSIDDGEAIDASDPAAGDVTPAAADSETGESASGQSASAATGGEADPSDFTDAMFSSDTEDPVASDDDVPQSTDSGSESDTGGDEIGSSPTVDSSDTDETEVEDESERNEDQVRESSDDQVSENVDELAPETDDDWDQPDDSPTEFSIDDGTIGGDEFDLSSGLDDLGVSDFDDELSTEFDEADALSDSWAEDSPDAEATFADEPDMDSVSDFEDDRDFGTSSSASSEDALSYESDFDPVDTTGTDFDQDELSPKEEVLAKLPRMAVPVIDVPSPPDTETDADLEEQTQSVRVDRDQVDSLLRLVEGLVTSRVRLRTAIEAREPYESLERELDDLEEFTAELQETVMDVRLVPLQTVTNRLPRVVRDLAREQDKQVAFDQSDADVDLDRSVLDRIGDPLIHLVRNAVDHGIEDPDTREAAGKPPEGSVELSAERTKDNVRIEISDDGSGLDADRLRNEAVEADILSRSEAEALSNEEAYELVFHSGLSTVDEVTDVSGRGVGMDVVKRTIDELNGSVSIQSEPDAGTTVTMTLPVSVAVDDVLFVESGGEQFGIPVDVVRDIVDGVDVIETSDGLAYEAADTTLNVIDLGDALDTGPSAATDDGMVVRIRDDVRDVGLRCDVVHARREVVLKPFEGFMRNVPGVSGATVRGRGEVITILDVTTL